MLFFIVLLGIGAGVIAVYLALLVSGGVLRFVASFVGVEGITLRNAMITSLLADLASAAVVLPIRLIGWPEPVSLWLLGMVAQGAVIRSRFATGLVVSIVIAVVVTVLWLVVVLILLGLVRTAVPGGITY